MRADTLTHLRPKTKQEPDISGLLLDAQLVDAGRIKLSLFKVKRAVDAINSLIIKSGLEIRTISDSPFALAHNDIAVIAFKHEAAEKRIAKAAFEAVGRAAA